MENQQQPPAPAMAARPWFRLASIRSTEIPVAPAAPPPVAPAVPPPVAAPRPPQPAAPPAAERPLFRLGSLLRTPGAAVPPPPQEPISQAPPQVQSRVPTPPPTAPTTPPPPPSPRTPLAAAAAQQDQQPPSPGKRSPVLAPSPAVRAPSPPATPPPPTSPTVIKPSEPILAPSAAVVRQQPQPTPPSLPPPRTTIVSPPLPPPVTILSPPAPAPSPRLPSPPLHPEPETKPVVTEVTAQPSRTQEPIIGLHKDKSNNINGNGGKKKLDMTQLGGQPRGVSPPLPSPTSIPKKPDPAAAAVPGKKKSGSTDEVESRMRVLTLAGENMGAYMNWGSSVPRGGMKGQGRHLTQTPTAQSVEKVAVAVAPGSNGGDASTDQHSYSAIKDVKQGPTGASKWKAGVGAAKPMAALVNSNVQSVNNSIMFNSSCEQQSPGVHITLSSGSRRPSSHRLSAGDSNGSTGGDANN